MTARDPERELDQALAAWLDAEPDTTPEAPVEAAIAFAYDHPRRRMPWSFRREAMSRPVWPRLRPVLIVAALVGLLGLTVGGAVLLGGQPGETPEPSREPGAGFFHEILEGEPIDPALFGEWLPEADYLGVLDVAFHAASSDICVETFHTNQDCLVLTDPRNTFDLNRGTFGGGIVVERDGTLVYREILGSPIRSGTLNKPCFTLRVDELMDYRIEGDRLFLAPSGACWPTHDTGWWRRP
jgi:hypothetical protein